MVEVQPSMDVESGGGPCTCLAEAEFHCPTMDTRESIIPRKNYVHISRIYFHLLYSIVL
jgi:hypothetical protein